MWRSTTTVAVIGIVVALALPAVPQRLDRGPTETLLAENDPEGIPNPSRGEAIALRAQGCGIEDDDCSACFVCHGREGEGSQSADVPRIAGQSYLYLYGALQSFASGERPHPVMTPVARALSRDAMRDVAAYYALAEPEFDHGARHAAALSDPGYTALVSGGVLANLGDLGRGVQACVNCHGPNGSGLPPVYPYLAGQYSSYLEGALRSFASGERGGGHLEIMQHIASRLTEREIRQVSQYFAAQRPADPPSGGLVTGLVTGDATETGRPIPPEEQP